MTDQELREFHADVAFEEWMSDARADLDGLEAQTSDDRGSRGSGGSSGATARGPW